MQSMISEDTSESSDFLCSEDNLQKDPEKIPLVLPETLIGATLFSHKSFKLRNNTSH